MTSFRFVVLCIPCLSLNREDVVPLIHRVSGNVQEGYNSRYEAERAYALAYAIGGVRVIPSRGSTVTANPMPPVIMEGFMEADENFLGAEWYVVFKGKMPGIYPAW